jgi:hypothetical protein
MTEEKRRPGLGTGAAETSRAAAVNGKGIRPFTYTSCVDGTCLDCHTTPGRIGVRACDRREQYVRRVAWPYWADCYRDRRTA